MIYIDQCVSCFVFFFFQAEDGIRDLVRSRGLGDVYKRQPWNGGSRGAYGVPTNLPAVDLRALGQDHCEGYGLSLIHI